MTVSDIMLKVAAALERAQVPFMLVGAFSSNYHGIPRSTQDVDFVIELNAPLTGEFSRLLGDDFEAEPQLSFETNTGTQRQEFRVKGTVFKVELFRLSTDPFDQQRFQRRNPVMVEGQQIWFPTPEDVIIMKLRWARGKDKDDVKEVMSVQRGKLDWNYIENWCKRHGSLALMEEIRRSVPET
jgi:predicted nucleotidyltransferase